MSLGDYATPGAGNDFPSIPAGTYYVKVDNAEGTETKNGTQCLKVRFRITEGEYVKQCIFKDYYITEKTLEKFLPWQFGILGIWDAVKETDTFGLGLNAAIDAIGKVINSGHIFSATTEIELNEWLGETRERINLLLTENLGTRVATVSATNSVPNMAPALDTDANDDFGF